VLAGDTRHTSGYNINSRTERKVYRLGEDNNLILATVGFGADSKDVAETMTRAVNVSALYSYLPVGKCLIMMSKLLFAGF
jgi:20S proteasome alpha/beta subunit